MSGAEPVWSALREPAAATIWREVLQPLATDLDASALPFATEIVDRSRAEVPVHFIDDLHVREAVAGTEETLRLLAGLLVSGADPALSELPPTTVAIVRSSVWRRVPLATHMSFLRHGHRLVWQWMFDRVVASAVDSGDQVRALELVTTLLMVYVDHAMVRADEVYEAERETWLRGAAASRAAAIEDLLNGTDDDQQALSERARYDLGRHHVGAVLWLDHIPGRGDALSVLSEAVSEVARMSGVEASITHPLGSLVLASWFSSRRPIEQGLLDRLTELPQSSALPKDVHLALGEPGRGLASFRRTHQEAVQARAVALLVAVDAAASITRYDEVAVLSLCTADPERAAQFVRRTLGDLADPSELSSRLVGTLRAYLAEGGSQSRTAAVLSVHANTVTYRVKQAEEILGRSVYSGTLELRLALALLPALPGLDEAERG